MNLTWTRNRRGSVSQVEGRISADCSSRIHFPPLIFRQAYGYVPQLSFLSRSLSRSLCINELSLCSCSFPACIWSPDRWKCHNYHFPETNVWMTCLVGGITVCPSLPYSLAHTSSSFAVILLTLMHRFWEHARLSYFASLANTSFLFVWGFFFFCSNLPCCLI